MAKKEYHGEPMKLGEIRKLPKANSPMWTTQWAYQGTARVPYIVSAKTVGGYNGLESGLEWACSCKDWCKHVPRQNCKHIWEVHKREGFLITASTLPQMPAEMKKDFQKFLDDKNAAMVSSQQSPFAEKGRKFRTQ
jgi:hypothetical protein